jgi:hypothetical protein
VRDAWRVRVGFVGASALLSAVLVLAPAPAQAGKGWGFKETFGGANKPTFGNDRSFAVDGEGRLLVYDNSGAPSISRWNPDGSAAPFAGLGTNLIDGKRGPGGKPCGEEAQSCDETPGNAGLGNNNNNNQVAVDDSGTATDGNVYLSDDVSDVVHAFSGGGAFLGQLTATGPSDGCSGQAFTPFTLAVGVAVDGEGNVHFSGGTASRIVAKYEPADNPPVNGDCVAQKGAGSNRNVAAGAGPSAGFLFVVGGSSVEKLDAVTETYGEPHYNFGVRSQVAVEAVTGHVFNPNGSKVTEYDASGAEGAAEVSLLEDAGSTVQAVAGAEAGELLYVGRADSEEIDVYEAREIPDPITGPPAGISGAKATVTGTVNPKGVKVSECFFEYGPTQAYGQTKLCDGGVVGLEDEIAHPVSAQLTGMRANGATYHYRLVVKGDLGGGQEGTAKGKDETLVTKETYTAEPASGIGLEEATLNGIVKPEGVAITGCFFEYGTTNEYGQSAPCAPSVNGEVGDADIAVSATITGLQPSTFYHYRLVAQNGLGLGQIVSADEVFATQGAPGIEAQMASELGETDATLQALLYPFHGETDYHFEWGTDTGYGNQTPTQTLAPGSEPVVVSAEIPGLAPQADYHFRLVAENEFGGTEGPDHLFETLNEHGLPDNRAFELVTPADKGPAGNVVAGFEVQVGPRPAADGDSFLWPLQNGMPETTAGGWLRMKASRVVDGDGVPRGWRSAQVSGPSLVEVPERTQPADFAPPSRMSYASDDLRCGVLESFNPLTSDTPQLSVELGVLNLYLWRADAGEVPYYPSPGEIAYRPAQAGEFGYELITNRLPDPEAKPPGGEGRYSNFGTAEDCSRVYFKSKGYRFVEGEVSGLYEWEAASGELRDAGLRPDGLPGPDMDFRRGRAVIGIGPTARERWNAVTPEGHLFFTARNAAGRPAVFMRSGGGIGAGGQVLEVSASETTATPANGARFEAASPDGSTIFFRANHGLDAEGTDDEPKGEQCGPLSGETVDSGSPPVEAKACDLYAYDVTSEELTDLTVDANPADPLGAAIQGTVAVDGDGSRAYFAALGQLTPGEGHTYAQNTAAGGRVNVYLHDSEADPGEELAYVTNLRWAEAMQFSLMRFESSLTAQASADGARLLYAATSRQSWYEGGGGAVAYLYDADVDEIRCVSCRPEGEPTAIAVDGQLFPGITDSPRLLAPVDFELNSLSADGSRAFFISTDVLMPGAEQGRPNVYEWEDGQLYFLAVAERLGKAGVLNELNGYRGMSADADGSSAFLATIRPLAPQDRDAISDVYAVRVDGEVPFVEPAPECQVDESVPLEPNQIYCQGARTPQPATSDPPSARFSEPLLPPDPCARLVRRAKHLAKRAKALRGKPERTKRLRRAARRNSKAAKRCRAKARAANANRGGAR